MKWLAACFVLVTVLLQGRLWLSGNGVAEVLRLRTAVESQRAEDSALRERNRQLGAEVRDLKQGYAALEERARSELGMIGSNESYYQVMPAGSGSTEPGPQAPLPLAPASPPPLRTAAR